MAISINGVTVAGIGKDGKNGTDGKDATINGVNALTLQTTGGLTGQQSGDTYTIDGSGILTSANEYTDSVVGEMIVTVDDPNNDLSSEIMGVISLDTGTYEKIMSPSCIGIRIVKQQSDIGFVEPDTVCLLSSMSTDQNGTIDSKTFANNDPSDLIYLTVVDNMIMVVNSESFVSDAYFASTIGNINTLLDQINGEVV